MFLCWPQTFTRQAVLAIYQSILKMMSMDLTQTASLVWTVEYQKWLGQ
jgi:hypothetical protein